jgi:hypothetical protein
MYSKHSCSVCKGHLLRCRGIVNGLDIWGAYGASEHGRRARTMCDMGHVNVTEPHLSPVTAPSLLDGLPTLRSPPACFTVQVLSRTQPRQICPTDAHRWYFLPVAARLRPLTSTAMRS